MSATVVLTSVGGPDSLTYRARVTVTGGVVAPYDVVFDWEETHGPALVTVTTSATVVTASHTYTIPGAHDIGIVVVNHGDDPSIVAYDFDVEIQALHTYKRPRLRQFPRDDALGGAPRQGHSSQSVQASARQGWAGTYR